MWCLFHNSPHSNWCTNLHRLKCSVLVVDFSCTQVYLQKFFLTCYWQKNLLLSETRDIFENFLLKTPILKIVNIVLNFVTCFPPLRYLFIVLFTVDLVKKYRMRQGRRGQSALAWFPHSLRPCGIIEIILIVYVNFLLMHTNLKKDNKTYVQHN